MSKRTIRLMAAWVAAWVLAGCGGSDGSGPGLTFVRSMHAVRDAPAMTVAADNLILSGAIFYNQSSTFSIDSFEGSTARRVVNATPILPDGKLGEPVLEEPITFSRDTEATVILTGSIEAMSVTLVETPRRLRPLSQLYMQFAHAAESVGALDVYVTSPDTPLTSTAPLYTIQPGGYGPSVQVPFDDLLVRLTRSGTLEVVYESETLVFEDNPDSTSDGAEFLMAVVDTLTAGASPVKLLAGISNGATRSYPDQGVVSGLRVVQASPDTPVFDVVVGDNFASPIGTSVAYKDATAMAPVPSGIVNLNFTVPGSTTEFVFEEQAELAPDASHTMWLIGEYENLAAVTAAGDRRSIATEARVRLMHAAPDADFISMYLGETATDPPNRDDRKFRDFRYGNVSPYLPVLPGDYKLTFTERFYTSDTNPDDAQETVIVGPVDITLSGGDVFTFLILPPETPGGPEVLEIYDDGAP